MPKTSLELIQELHASGSLSKEAAARIMVKRDKLIKQALAKTAAEFFKGAGWLSRGTEAAAAAEKSGGGFKGLLSKLKSGGLTPNPAGPANSPGWSDVASNLTKMLALAGITAGATAGIGAISRNRRDKQTKGEIESSYKQMFEEYPQLNEMQQSNPGLLNRTFSVLERFAPSLAANPTVAGAFVLRQGDMQTFDPQTIRMLTDTQRHIDEVSEQHSPMQHLDRGVNIAQKALNPFSGGSARPGA